MGLNRLTDGCRDYEVVDDVIRQPRLGGWRRTSHGVDEAVGVHHSLRLVEDRPTGPDRQSDGRGCLQ